MQRWGVTACGRIRFHCARCRHGGIRRRPDHAQRRWQQVYVAWITGSLGLMEVARRQRVSLSTVQRHFRDCGSFTPLPRQPTDAIAGLILDGTGVARHQRVALIVRDPTCGPVTWTFAERESFDSWWRLLDSLRAEGMEPRFVVCDGHTGLLKALRHVWPHVLIQRCLIHVVRQARLDLTQSPKTDAGLALLDLVNQILMIRTRRQRRRWLRAYRQWRHRHDAFLKERTLNPEGPRRWWYTHRKLRGVRSLLSNSLPDLFHFIRHPEIPRTTNHVEGGINSRLKDLFRRHRGLSVDRKTTLTAWYLSSRQSPKKPTRNDH